MKKIIAALLIGAIALTSVFAAKKKNTVVKLGVVGSIYEDLWTPAQKALKKQGIDLKFVQFSDYVTPNNALANGEKYALDKTALMYADVDGAEGVTGRDAIEIQKFDAKIINKFPVEE